MTTAYQLPEDIGQKSVTRNGTEVQAASEFPAGQTTAAKSLPTVLPRDNATLPIIDNYRSATEIDRDLLGFPRATTPFNFLTKNDAYELSEDSWIYDVTGLNERPQLDSTQSARWTQILNATAAYTPAPNGEVRYNSSASSAQLFLNTNDGGFQRARICTKKRYRYQPGRIVRASLATKLSVKETPISVTRLWGVGDTNDGFFVECSGDGVGDRLQILYRNSAGNGLKFETRVPRSQWTGDKVDGTGDSKAVLDLSQTFMTMVEWGWYGASDVRIYFYLVDKNESLPTSITQIPRARWILAHELVLADTAVRNDLVESDGGSGTRTYDVPSLRSPSLPIWVEINNSGNISRSEFIERYGASVLVDGGTTDRAKITTVDAGFDAAVEPVIGGLSSGSGTSVLTIRSKNRLINADNVEVDNFLVTNPLTLNVGASDLVEIEIWKDPVMVTPTQIGHINGSLPYRTGDYVSPFNLVPQLITSFDSTQTEFAITQENPTNEKLTVNTQYTSGDLLSLDVSFNDYRIVQSGRQIASFIVDAGGATIDLQEFFSAYRENISTEYDAPTEFPVRTDTLSVDTFDTSTGLITLDPAFPHRLFLGQRVSLGSTNYYVLTLDSSTSFTLKAAKVNTVAVLTGIAAKDTLVAHYDLDLSSSVAASLKPIYRSEVVFVAKPFNASYTSLNKADEYDAEWMSLINTTSSNAYSVQTAPTVNLYLTNGVV